MISMNYIDSDFMSYLNRYLIGFTKFAGEIKSIDVTFELCEAFSNHSIRFSIDPEFKDLGKLMQEHSEELNACFYNSDSVTGNQFVSFIYEHNNSCELNMERIESFMMHYQFASKILTGFLGELLPDREVLHIRPLESEPFMSYFTRFALHKRNNEPQPRFQKQYFDFCKRSFEFDYLHHEELMRNAAERSWQNTVSDLELCDAGGGKIADIRSYVLREKIPYGVAACSSTVDRIFIDATILRQKIGQYVSDSYEDIRPAAIVACLDRMEREKELEALRQEQRCKQLETLMVEAGVAVGDYIYIKKQYGSDYCIGKVVAFDWGYGERPLVKYNVLKKDLTESRRALQDGSLQDVRYILKPEVFEQELNREGIALESRFVALCKKSGQKPVLPKEKKKRLGRLGF